MRKKLVFISSIAAPHQLKLCECLQETFEAEFWFYDYIGKNRPSWWKLGLPAKCKVLNSTYFKNSGRYVSFELNKRLEEYNPDIVMLGGFFIPSNYLAYRWAKKNSKKVIIFTETFRKNGKLRQISLKSRLLDYLYRDVDAVFACHEDAAEQMKRMLPVLGEKTFAARYAADIDDYFEHPVRENKAAYTYIFPNRLTEDYNPLLAIEIFSEIVKQYPKSVLKINQQGELFCQCNELINKLGIHNSVSFLSDIKHWTDLSKIYETSDVLLFPANFSNGNFTIIECMASGLGIVVSNRIKGQTKLIKNGENGFVCNPDKESFLEAAFEYIDKPGMFRSHAIINREMVRPLSGSGTAKLYAKLIYQMLEA